MFYGRDPAACKGGSQYEYCKKYGNRIFHRIFPLFFLLVVLYEPALPQVPVYFVSLKFWLPLNRAFHHLATGYIFKYSEWLGCGVF